MSAREGEIIDGQAQPVGESRAVQEYRPPSNPFDQDPAQFAVQVQQRGDNYATLISWLVANLVPGEDLVQVHFVKRDKCRAGGPHPYGDCTPTTDPGHWSDPDLSKRGAEKICGLLGLGARFLGMEDFRRMALKGSKIQDVIIDCEIFGASREAMSQGTGACSIDEVGGSLNRAMKTAAKRAHIDAVKRIAGLSGIATELKRRMKPIDLERAQQGRPQPGTQKPDAGDRPRQAYNTGAVLTHCPVGKQHKGKPWREIPSDYLEWLIRELGDKPDLVKAAAGELAKRRKPDSGSTHNPAAAPSPAPAPAGHVDPDFDDEIPF
jgi:hypothetical protein